MKETNPGTNPLATAGVKAAEPLAMTLSRRPGSSLLPDLASRISLRKKRARRDKLARWGITTAGYGVVVALLTIFVYLFYEVTPILRGATVDAQHQYALPEQQSDTYRLLLDRYEILGIQYTRAGEAVFF